MTVNHSHLAFFGFCKWPAHTNAKGQMPDVCYWVVVVMVVVVATWQLKQHKKHGDE